MAESNSAGSNGAKPSRLSCNRRPREKPKQVGIGLQKGVRGVLHTFHLKGDGACSLGRHRLVLRKIREIGIKRQWGSKVCNVCHRMRTPMPRQNGGQRLRSLGKHVRAVMDIRQDLIHPQIKAETWTGGFGRLREHTHHLKTNRGASEGADSEGDSRYWSWIKAASRATVLSMTGRLNTTEAPSSSSFSAGPGVDGPATGGSA